MEENKTLIYDVIQRYFQAGNYTADQIKKFVLVGQITPHEYESITNQPYTEAKPGIFSKFNPIRR